MKAKDMFEQLGYMFIPGGDVEIYRKEKDGYEHVIYFTHNEKTVDCFEAEGILSYVKPKTLTLKELKAINQQVKELHWND